MFKSVLTALSVCFFAAGYAQSSVLPKVTKEDLQMTSYPRDKEADAVKMYDYRDVSYEEGVKTFIHSRTKNVRRIKILKQSAVNRGDIKIQFIGRDNFETIEKINGCTYNLSENGEVKITKLEKSAVFTKKVDNTFSEVAFTLPEIKEGSIIEYEYNDVLENYSYIADWYFQDEIPTVVSSYQIALPAIFKVVRQLTTNLPVDTKENTSLGRLYYRGSSINYNVSNVSFAMKNVPGIRYEPYMSSAKDYLQRVQFQLSGLEFPNGERIDVRQTWPKLSEELLNDEDFGGQIKKNLPRTSDLNRMLDTAKSDYAKMTVIYEYVKDNMTQNNINTIYSVSGLKSAWDKKSGSNGEVNMVLINLLKDAGLKVSPLLVSTRENGRINPYYPFLKQFNHVVAMVMLNDRRCILDAVNKNNRPNLIPEDLVNTQAFMLSKTEPGIIDLIEQNPTAKNGVFYNAELTDDGKLQGYAQLSYSGYGKPEFLDMYLDSKANFTHAMQYGVSNLNLDSIDVQNEKDDNFPTEVALKFSVPVNGSGNYRYIRLNLFNDLTKNVFTNDKRFSDIEFNYLKTYTVTGSVVLPDGYTVDELPKNIRMITPDTGLAVTRIIQADKGLINFSYRTEILKVLYEVEEYPDFKEFYKKLFDLLEEQIVVKKK